MSTQPHGTDSPQTKCIFKAAPECGLCCQRDPALPPCPIPTRGIALAAPSRPGHEPHVAPCPPASTGAGHSLQRLLDQAFLQGGLLLQGRPGLPQVLQPGFRAPLVLAHLPGQVDMGLKEGSQQRVATLGFQQL